MQNEKKQHQVNPVSGMKAPRKPSPKFQKTDKKTLAMDESTISALFEVRKIAYADNKDIFLDMDLLRRLLTNPNAVVATMKSGGALAGFGVATPINEGWVKDDLQEIKDVMKPHMKNADLFDKISAAMESSSCYYIDDIAIAKGAAEAARQKRSPIYQLNEYAARFKKETKIVRSFFSQLEEHSAKFLIVHGRTVNGEYEDYKNLIERNGFRKIQENDHPDWFGGEKFKLMVFEKL